MGLKPNCWTYSALWLSRMAIFEVHIRHIVNGCAIKEVEGRAKRGDSTIFIPSLKSLVFD